MDQTNYYSRNVFYKQYIFAIFYRFCKTYDIPITENYIYRCFEGQKRRIFIDAMCCDYINGMEDILVAKDTRLMTILDYYWCTFIHEHYDEIIKLNLGPNFILMNKYQINNLINELKGKEKLKYMPESKKKELKLDKEFIFKFQI